MIGALQAWFAAGGPLMPAILGLALALHALCLYRIVAALRGEDARVALGLIQALVAALPLLGLLASVGGIMRTFDLAASGARAQVAARGVGEALIATELALGAAVPALLAHGWLSRRARLQEGRARLQEPQP